MEQLKIAARRGPHDGKGSLLSRRRFLRVVLGVGSGLLGARLPIALARPAAKPNIILLTADSLRADHMGAYGYARPTTPHLDRLAAESVLFESAFAPISYTGPSLASLHTGKYPQENFMGYKNGNAPYRHTDSALAALLQAHGYQTAAFVSNTILERNRSQMDKGFAHYDDTLPDTRYDRVDVIPRRSAAETTAAVLQWLKTRAKPPFFLWVHYIEPHGPYAPPPPYDRLFVNDPLYRAERRLLELSPEQRRGEHIAREARVRGHKVTPRMIGFLDGELGPDGRVLRYNPSVADSIARYDGEIRSLDEAIGQLLQALKARGLYDTSWLLFSSDHGESLGEGGFYFVHALRLTLDLLRVPLLVKPPGTPVPRRVGTQVSLIDLMPTLLEAVGSKVPPGLSGQSALPLLQGAGANGSRLVFSEKALQYSLIDDRYQLLAGYDTPTAGEKAIKRVALEFNTIPVSLFAYRGDPVGERNLVRVERIVAEVRFRHLRSFLVGYLQRTATAAREKRAPVQESAKTLKALKYLGY